METNIAILILAHHNPEQLSLLVNHLCSDFSIYVQIDKKSNISIQELPKHEHVFYFKEIDVYWGHFSQIENMHYLLKKAYFNEHSHYIFISGDDLPIKSNQDIKHFFYTNKQSIYMYANPLPIPTWGFNNGFDRLDRYWFMKSNNRKFVKVFGRLTLIIQRILNIKVKRFVADYYAGSNWLNLTHESLQTVFNFLEANPKYLKKLKYSRATDEIWIQTIIMNSPLKNKVVNYDLRYIDWETGPDFPRILNQDDDNELINSKALFARKFSYFRDKPYIIKLLKILK